MNGLDNDYERSFNLKKISLTTQFKHLANRYWLPMDCLLANGT